MYSLSVCLWIVAAASFVGGFSNAFVPTASTTTLAKRGVSLFVSKTHALNWLRDAPNDLALIRRRTVKNKNNDQNGKAEEQDEIPLYKGVYRQKNKKWKAMISWQGQRHHLGCYESQHEAAVMYAKAAWMLQHPNNNSNNMNNKNNSIKSDKTHEEKVPFFLIADDDLEETEQEESFLEDLIAISSDLRDIAVHEYKKIDWGQVKHKVEDFFENSEMIHSLQEESDQLFREVLVKVGARSSPHPPDHLTEAAMVTLLETAAKHAAEEDPEINEIVAIAQEAALLTGAPMP